MTVTCAGCHRTTESYFEVVRMARGRETQRVVLCSIACVVKWAHDYAVSSGMKIAIAAQGAVRNAKDAARGLLKAIKGG